MPNSGHVDLRVLLQNQTQYIQSLEKETTFKITEIENERLKRLCRHQRMRFGTKSEAFNTPQQDLFAEDWAKPMKPTCSNSWNTSPEQIPAPKHP
ncbi:MAG: transposase [Moraxellaceae bacterium]|nr:transposase [Moraxellaceae bacterium]